MKNDKAIWNHNYAYYRWVLKKVGQRKRILDVGCGDGALCVFLRTNDNDILGIDSSASSIEKAKRNNVYNNVAFSQTTFEDFPANGKRFDAVIFVASIHHMDMADAIDKSKQLLADNGILVIVGTAAPSDLLDWIIEAARIIPSKIISLIKRNTTSEEMDIKVSYDFPAMKKVRQICGDKLCGYTLRYGLHYRYLLTWENNRTDLSDGMR